MRWRLKRLVLGIEHVRMAIGEWPWDTIAWTFILELGGGAVTALVMLAFLSVWYGNPDKAPNMVAIRVYLVLFGVGNFIVWWCYLHVWSRIVRWAKTAERVVTQLNQRG